MAALPFDLRPHLIGGGRLETPTPSSIRMLLPPTARGYVDAQVDDYQRRRRSDFPWAAPMSVSLRARASHPAPPGTLGFGFWNDPFGVSLGGAGGVRRFPAAPQAVWFFYGSPPNDFTFASEGAVGPSPVQNGTPGQSFTPAQAHASAQPPAGWSADSPVGAQAGWKAAVIRAPGLPAWIVAPGAAIAFLLAAIPVVRVPVVRAIRRAVGGAEALVGAGFDQWRRYRIEWRPDRVVFAVDGAPVLSTPVAPRGRLGFVAWIDNQFAVLSEQRGIRFGTLPTETEAWLEIADLEFERG